MTKSKTQRHKCRRKYCPNFYDELIGEPGSWSKRDKGGECVPCMFAIQLASQGMEPDTVSSSSELAGQFDSFLSKTGWCWQDVIDSYQRIQGLPEDVLDAELLW